HYVDKGTIKEKETNKHLKYSYWSAMSGIEDKPENYADISYDLQDDHGKTVLTITQENVPTEEMKKHSEQNWNTVLGNLKKMLEKPAGAAN
ncbi:MAG: SRPBCC family protein, partial [Bacteroidia bacterium]